MYLHIEKGNVVILWDMGPCIAPWGILRDQFREKLSRVVSLVVWRSRNRPCRKSQGSRDVTWGTVWLLSVSGKRSC